MRVASARKILCYGVCGSGKTTLASRLSERTGIPWHSVDDLTWGPGWTEIPLETQRERIASIVAGSAWILDTAYGKWIDIPLSEVELIVALDYPRWLSFSRLLKRCVLRALDRRPVCNGNIESWRNMVSRESILLWHLKSFSKKRQRIRSWAMSTTAPDTLVIKTPRQLAKWLASIPVELKQIDYHLH